MTELSPAVQAVLDAMYEVNMDFNGENSTLAAAALEAVADEVVPFAEITSQEDLESRREAMVWGMQHQAQLTRQQFRTIAAELRGTTPTETP